VNSRKLLLFSFQEIAKEKTAGLWSGLTGSAAFQKVGTENAFPDL